MRDPSGLECTVWIPITHGPRGIWIDEWKKTIDEIDDQDPEFDKCDMIGPVCCWVDQGVRRCKYRFGPNVIPESWPDDWEDVIDTSTGKGKSQILKIFKYYLPRAMAECCSPFKQGENKRVCGCKECKVAFVCHPDMVKYMDPFVDPLDPRMPQTNPCGKVWTFDCSGKSWKDKGGNLGTDSLR